MKAKAWMSVIVILTVYYILMLAIGQGFKADSVALPMIFSAIMYNAELKAGEKAGGDDAEKKE